MILDLFGRQIKTIKTASVGVNINKMCTCYLGLVQYSFGSKITCWTPNTAQEDWQNSNSVT